MSGRVGDLSSATAPATFPRISIPPAPEGEERPLWSVMIPTHNCADFLRQTLAGVLSQDPGPDRMQIEVVDDCSTADDPRTVVEELGRGRVAFYQQPNNVGHTRNFDTCLLRSRGRLVHLLHGDDAVRDGFYRIMERPFAAHSEIGAAFCQQILMDEGGHWMSMMPLVQRHSGVIEGWLERVASGHPPTTPAVVVRREVYERLGGFDQRIRAYGEDWEMWVRIAAHYPIWYEVEPLALYRSMRADSLSSSSFRSGEDVRDLTRAIEVIGSYLPLHLPPCRAREVLDEARAVCSGIALAHARKALGGREIEVGLAQLRAGTACDPSLATVARVAGVIAWAEWRLARLLLRRAVDGRGR